MAYLLRKLSVQESQDCTPSSQGMLGIDRPRWPLGSAAAGVVRICRLSLQTSIEGQPANVREFSIKVAATQLKENQMIYIENFFTEHEADEMFLQLRALPHERNRNKMYGGQNFLRRLSFPGWSPEKEHRPAGQYKTEDFEGAPDFIKAASAKLSDYAGKEIKYLSTIGYENERDAMNYHQHKEDQERDRVLRGLGLPGADMSVWVLNFGERRTIGIRPKGSKLRSEYESLRTIRVISQPP